LQIIFFKACVISIAQYKNKNTSFVGIYINKFMQLFGKQLPMKRIRFFLDWILPLFFLGLAYLIQNYFGLVPLVGMGSVWK